jgi:general secretion pathway protein K
MRRPGFALIAVFWIIMVVGLFAVIVASRTGFNIERSGWALDIGRVRAAADGAAEEAAFQLIGRLGSGLALPNLADLARFEVVIDDITVQVAMEDEDGKIDLNGAQPELLSALLQVLIKLNPELTAEEPVILAERVADFRDIDNLRRINGAEDPEYLAEGLSAGAKDAAFDTVDELSQVLGMTPDIIAAAEPYLTVYSARSQFDPDASSMNLKPMIEIINADGLLSSVAPSRRRVFTVTARAAMPNGVNFTRRAGFRITGNLTQPVVWFGWRSDGG